MPKAKKRILIVDESDLNTELYKEMINSYSERQPNLVIEVITAPNFAEALKVINGKDKNDKKCNLDLVITDKNMPHGIDDKKSNYGNQVAQRAQDQGIRVIGMTGGELEDFDKRYVNDMIKKPFSSNTVYHVLNQFLKENTYDGNSPEDSIKYYSTGILSEKVTPDPSLSADTFMRNLEKIVTIEGDLKTRSKFSEAKNIYDKLCGMIEGETYSENFELLKTAFDEMNKSYKRYRKERK